MRVGYVVTNFPPLSETFIRREILALCAAGDSVFVYTNVEHHDPLVAAPEHERLTIRQIPFARSTAALAEAAAEDGIDHLHGTLMITAQRAAAAAATVAGLPFTITAYSGHTVFTAREPIYADISANPLCGGIVVEDDFMREWVTAKLGALGEKTFVIPNSLDLTSYPPRRPGPARAKPGILAIARFVEKKGLINLVEAFAIVRAQRPAELHLIGKGPEEERLRRAAKGVPDIHFHGLQSEAACQQAYGEADVFAMPCVRASDGDADGIPTTVLEAMSSGLAVVTSDLLSAGCYITDHCDGLLVPPGDRGALADALRRLCDDPALRDRLGRSARRRVEERCDIRRNIVQLRELFGRSQRLRKREDLMTNESMPLVSIAITTYNRERLVAECVQSAIRQTYPNVEIVVVDDGSTDDTMRVLAQFNGRLRVLQHEMNRGIAAAKNNALRATSAGSTYVAILDSDDQLEPRFVERCVTFLESHSDVGLVYVNEVLIDDRGRRTSVRRNTDPWSTEEWLRTCHLKGDGWMARRNLVLATDLHDERMPMDVDYDLFYQLLERTSFAHLAEPLVLIRRHGDQRTRDALTLARCHAANLVKYGYSPEYAYLRARRHPEWLPAIEEGIDLGKRMSASRHRRKGMRSSPEKLAIDGGDPVRGEFLRFGSPTLGSQEIEEAAATLRSGWIGPGPRVERFEKEFAEYVCAPHAIGLSSCTAGLFLNLLARGIGPGDEVITTAMTFAATANVIEHVGATPVFADIDPDTLNLDPASVEARISPRTRAIIPVHFGGLPCDMAALEALAERRGLVIIEDAAHAVGAKADGRMIGSGRNPAVFSFYANKNLTTAEGGMATTADDALAQRLRLLRSHGLDAGPWERLSGRRSVPFDVLEAGYKCNMSDLAAAIGLPQLAQQENWLRVRGEYAHRYDAAFADLPVRLQKRPADGSRVRSSLHLYVMQLNERRWRVSRDEVVAALQAENIGATIHYPALHLSSYYRRKYRFSEGMLPNAERTGRTIFTLPLSPSMTLFDVDDVIDAVTKVASAYAAW